MKRRLYQKLILAWICFAVLSFVSVAGITSSLVEKHLIKNKTEGMYREANVIAAGRHRTELHRAGFFAGHLHEPAGRRLLPVHAALADGQ